MRRLIHALAAALLTVGAFATPARAAGHAPGTPIAHLIVLMQGGRSFDNYFGTYPGADGLPPGVCQQVVLGAPKNGCVRPHPLHGAVPPQLFVSRSIVTAQYDGGRMDGFVAAYHGEGRDGAPAMGYYDARDLPFSWAAADRYVLFDRFFAAALHGIRLNRSYWVAAAPPPGDAERVPPGGYGNQPTIFDRLQAAGVSWKVYVQHYEPAETFRARSAADPDSQTARVPLLNYARFVDDPALRAHVVDLDQYYRDLADGTLPAVAYVASSGASERSARSLPAGQDLTRNLVNQLMVSRSWDSAALLWTYDGSGGWYDHVPPPRVDGQAQGLRVPALLVSPYVARGQVNHTIMGYRSVLRFIEENWRLDPLTAWDAKANSLAGAFRFTAKPRPAEVIVTGGARPAAQLVRVGIVYRWYTAVLVVVLLLLVYSATRPALRRRLARAPRHAPRHRWRTR